MKKFLNVFVGIFLLSSCLGFCVACNNGNKEFVQDGIHYRQVYNLESCWVTGCDDDIEVVNIPSKVKGMEIFGIEEKAFNNQTNIKEIILADSTPLEYYRSGWAPFRGCTSVEKITSPRCDIRGLFSPYGLTEKENAVPASVKYVYLTNACTEIYIQDLYYCKNIQELHIPKSVTKITDGTNYTSIGVNGHEPTGRFGNLPFIGCEKLTIYCEAESKPSGWGAYWNYIDSENQALVYWGAY